MNKTDFKRFGLMMDMSRNSVMNMASLKKLIPAMADMGYNFVMLYTEDTYEIPEEPYFGHFRGRYTQAELKDFVAFCEGYGMEVIPCIQTLAHLNGLMRWPRFQRICDCNDILLAEEEKTYELIDKMFKSVKECFKSDVIHVGLDEAHMLGLGKYLDRHGFPNMEATYHITRDGIMTINFAYTQNGITVYSDLIKVSVALDDGSIVGMEARGYVMSHRSRTLPRPAISEAEGRAVVSSRLTIQSENLALIPTSGQNEVLCREYVCTDEEGRHIIVYVNARTGQEENIYLLVEDENGILTI